MPKYRKKPIVIEAIKWTGENIKEIEGFCSKDHINFHPRGKYLEIGTLEGWMEATKGDYIIKGIEGEFYPCKPDIFHKTYDEVGEEPTINMLTRDQVYSLAKKYIEDEDRDNFHNYFMYMTREMLNAFCENYGIKK